ncbi:MAG: BTAD domain-containing putative transcriptional regulator [Acidimicrobiia bacterium]
MSVRIHLLGKPRLEAPGKEAPRPKGRKAWALLAYLVLRETPADRTQLASLLFSEADDPAATLRWNLSELRRVLPSEISIEGDPVRVSLGADAWVDVLAVQRGSWLGFESIPGIESELLEGFSFADSPGFEAWLLLHRRHLAAGCEAMLRESTLALLARGQVPRAVEQATRLVRLNPLDDNHQALLIRCYRVDGDYAAAEAQLASCRHLFQKELGEGPGPSVMAALKVDARASTPVKPLDAAAALVEAGRAAVEAGAFESGLNSLRSAVGAARTVDDPELLCRALLAQAEALVHAARGRDEEGAAALHEAARIAHELGADALRAKAAVEIGYIDFLGGRYERAETWLTSATDLAGSDGGLVARAKAYLGSCLSDRADYVEAARVLHESREAARLLGERRIEAYAGAMLGRLHLLRGDLGTAAHDLDESFRIAEEDRWLAFLPWPQAIRGEVALAQGRQAQASGLLDQAFARACQLGDPCWEGMAARGLGLVAAARGEATVALETLIDARTRCSRLPDAYLWMEAHVLDALCALAREHAGEDAGPWIDELHDISSRAGMRELVIRSLIHAAGLGDPAAMATAEQLRERVDNPHLDGLFAG